MSDRQIAKNRWHRGVSAEVRTQGRRAGLSIDEEAAQFALDGLIPLVGEGEEVLTAICASALNDRRALMTAWEKDHPHVNPYPPSFPERALKLVREALQASYDEDGNPAYHLERLKLLCENELTLDPTTTEDPEDD